jgi:hypothetical protein
VKRLRNSGPAYHAARVFLSEKTGNNKAVPSPAPHEKYQNKDDDFGNLCPVQVFDKGTIFDI